MTAAVATDHPAATAGRMAVAAAAALRSAVRHGSLGTVTSQDQSPTSFMTSSCSGSAVIDRTDTYKCLLELGTAIWHQLTENSVGLSASVSTLHSTASNRTMDATAGNKVEEVDGVGASDHADAAGTGTGAMKASDADAAGTGGNAESKDVDGSTTIAACTPLEASEGTVFDPHDCPNWSMTMQHIADRLYFGGLSAANNKELLVRNNITRVLTLLGEPNEAHPDQASYFTVHVKDSQGASGPVMKAGLPAGLEWVHAAIQEGHNVLVHCSSGVSRSGTAVLAYLVKYRGASLADAWRHVAARRRCILPNDTFMDLLREWEKEWHGAAESTVSTVDYQAWNLHAVTNKPEVTYEKAHEFIARANGNLDVAYAYAVGLM